MTLLIIHEDHLTRIDAYGENRIRNNPYYGKINYIWRRKIMKKIDWKPVKDFAELVCGAASYVLILAASAKAMERVTAVPESSFAGYDDAIGAIMKSSMYSHDKARAAAALKQNGTSAFYKAIIHVAKDSSMYSHDKVSMIEELSQD